MEIRKIVNKSLKNKKPEYAPMCLSIQKVCKKENSLQYFDQICRRILREYEKHEELGEYIRVDIKSGLDILLDEDGIMMFLEILEGYFDRDEIISVWKALRDYNRLHRDEYQFDHIFDHLSAKELKKTLGEYRSMTVEPKYEPGRQMVIDKAKAELKKRNRLAYLVDFIKV